MSYKLAIQEQEKYDYGTFLEIIKKIEDNFTDNVSKYINGRCIFVMLQGAFNQTYFVKTTVSDLRDVIGEIKFDCIIDNSGNFNNICLYSLREPNKKDFRGKIKYTPKGTLAMTTRFIADGEDGKKVAIGWDKMPVLQDEKFLVSSCYNAFDTDEKYVDYDYIMKNSFRLLTNDKRFKCGDDWITRDYNIESEVSMDLQYIISNMYDIQESWGVVYYWKGNEFIFPMKREYIQEIFKKRDKENGRRRTIASIVNGYSRKDGTKVDGHLRSSEGFSIDGREFCIFIGAEDFEKIFPKTEKSKKRLHKYANRMKEIGNSGIAYIENK